MIRAAHGPGTRHDVSASPGPGRVTGCPRAPPGPAAARPRHGHGSGTRRTTAGMVQCIVILIHWQGPCRTGHAGCVLVVVLVVTE
eukprot:2922139-Rhodomonas_salina.1